MCENMKLIKIKSKESYVNRFADVKGGNQQEASRRSEKISSQLFHISRLYAREPQ